MAERFLAQQLPVHLWYLQRDFTARFLNLYVAKVKIETVIGEMFSTGPQIA